MLTFAKNGLIPVLIRKRIKDVPNTKNTKKNIKCPIVKPSVIKISTKNMGIRKKSLDCMNKPFFIIDEFHNLSKNNVTNEDDLF